MSKLTDEQLERLRKEENQKVINSYRLKRKAGSYVPFQEEKKKQDGRLRTRDGGPYADVIPFKK